MKLTKLEINNFRGIKNAEIYFNDHTVIVGPNNSGKSTIVDAIALLLGREKLARDIGDYDFFGGNPKPQDRILIKGLLTDFPNNNPSDSPDWFNEHDGGIACWLNTKTGNIFHGEKEEDCILAIEIGFCARFNRNDLEYETIRFFITSDGDPFEDTSIVTLKSHRHLHDLGMFLLPSKRMWDRTISFGSELFNKVVRFQEAIPGDTITDLRDSLRSVKEKIEEVEPLKTIVQRINHELLGFLNSERKSISFLPTSGDISGVLNSITPFVQGENDTEIPLAKHGSGLISLQTLLLLLEFGRYRNEIGKNFFLISEEPELHLNPSVHRRLVSRIRGLCNQSITTTHAPDISAFFKPEEILILKNENGQVTAKTLFDGNRTLPNSIMKLFTLHRTDVCEALMHDKVIIPEGITEFHWLKSLFNVCTTAEGWDVYNLKDSPTKYFGIIPTQDAAVVRTYLKFCNFISSVTPFVDGDAEGNEYVKSLIVLQTPPKIIFQLSPDWCLENLLEWLISPNTELIIKMEASMEKFNGRTFQEFLKTHKTNWIYHKQILELIIETESSFLRSQKFLNSIYSIEDIPEELKTFWKEDEVRSTEKTKIFVFQAPIL